MSDFAGDRRLLLDRIRSIRMSLRGTGVGSPEETPVEEYERRRFESGIEGTERLAVCLIAWLGTHGVALLLFAGNVAAGESWQSWPWWRMIGPGFFGLLSVLFALIAATCAFRDRSVLKRRWTAAGFLPWIVLMTESAILLLPFL